MDGRRRIGEFAGLGLLGIGFAGYWLVFRHTLPSASVLSGDFTFFIPRLLAGYYHFVTNGPFHIPWFSPAQCGGLPFYPDPQVSYFSLPQWLTFVVGPARGVVLSVHIMAAAGALGAYALLRTPFRASPAAAAAGAILFLFNGMYVARMTAGHLPFQPFMLAPWAAWAVLTAAGNGRWGVTRALGAVIAAALVFAIAFQGAMVHLLVPLGLSIAAVMAIHGAREGHSLRPWILLGLGGVTAILLSAQRLAATLSYLAEFPRDYYGLPGFPSISDGILMAVWSVFWSTPGQIAVDRLANTSWQIGPLEWDFSVGPVAAALMVAGAVALVARAVRRGGVSRTTINRGLLATTILMLVFAAPVAVNVYTPEWNAVLKKLPLISSSVLMVRWFAVYILPATVAAALALDVVVRTGVLRWAGAIVVLAVTVTWNMSVERGGNSGQEYDLVVAGWELARSPDTVPPITDVAPVDIAGISGLAIGFTPVHCYQPMFGYRLETYPLKELEPGPALAVNRNGNLNIKNPACYVFPEANSCEPGDHFSEAERDKAELFLSYRNFPFERPLRQRIAGQINLWTPAALVLLLGTAIVLDRRRHVGAGPAAGDGLSQTTGPETIRGSQAPAESETGLEPARTGDRPEPPAQARQHRNRTDVTPSSPDRDGDV